MTNQSPATNIATQTLPESQPIKVTKPRSLWFDAALILLSAGAYSQFLLVGMVRDIKKLTNNEKLTPWLWFFVPSFLLAQLFALPRLNTIITGYEDQLQLTNRHSVFKGWTAITFIVCAGYTVVLRQSENVWLVSLVVVLYTAVFLVWINRIKQAKQADERAFEAKKSKHWWEYATLVSLSVFWLAIVAMLGYEALTKNVIATYPENSLFIDQEIGVEFPMNNWSWVQVDEEDSDAIYAFEAFDLELYAYLFEYSDYSINNLAKARFGEALQENENAKCTEHQHFQADSFYVRSILSCHGSNLFGQYSQASVITEKGNKTIELFIRAEPNIHSHEDILTTMNEAVEGFKIQ